MVSSYNIDKSRDIVQVEEWKCSGRGGKYARGKKEMIAVGLKY